MVQNARRRLLIVVKTPMLLLGPKPYNSVHKNDIANQFYQALISWIETMKTDENKKMLYLYSVEDTGHEMREKA